MGYGARVFTRGGGSAQKVAAPMDAAAETAAAEAAVDPFCFAGSKDEALGEALCAGGAAPGEAGAAPIRAVARAPPASRAPAPAGARSPAPRVSRDCLGAGGSAQPRGGCGLPSAAPLPSPGAAAEADPFAFDGSDAALPFENAQAAVPFRGGAAKRVTWGTDRLVPPAEPEPVPAPPPQQQQQQPRRVSDAHCPSALLAALDECRFSMDGVACLCATPPQRLSSACDAADAAAQGDTRRALRAHKLWAPLLRAALSLAQAPGSGSGGSPAMLHACMALLTLLTTDPLSSCEADALAQPSVSAALRMALSGDAAAGADWAARLAASLRRARTALAQGEASDGAALALVVAERGCTLAGGTQGARAQFKASLRASGALVACVAQAAGACDALCAHGAAGEAQLLAAAAARLLRCTRVLEQACFESEPSAAEVLGWRKGTEQEPGPSTGGPIDPSGPSGRRRSRHHHQAAPSPSRRDASRSPELGAAPADTVAAALQWLEREREPGGDEGGAAHAAAAGADADAAADDDDAASGDDGGLVASLCSALQPLHALSLEPGAVAVSRGCAAAALRGALHVLTNLTNERPEGARALLSTGGMARVAELLPALAKAALGPQEQPCDPGAASPAEALNAALCALANAVEVHAPCAHALQPRMPFLAQLFAQASATAAASQATGAQHAAAQEGEDQDDDDVTTESLEAAERGAAALIVAAYAAMLLACLLHARVGGDQGRLTVSQAMPGGTLKPLLTVLERFSSFHEGMNTLSPKAAAKLRECCAALRACAMETPSNAEALSLLARTTLGAFLEERGCSATTGAQPIVLDADASVGLAMEALQRYKISSLPVLAPPSPTPHNVRPTALFHGFVDVPVLLDAFLKGDYLRRATGPARPPSPPLHTSTAETLSAMPSKLPEDLPQSMPMLGLLETLNAAGPRFANLTLRHVAPGRDGELLYGAATEHSMLQIVRDGFLSPPAAGVAACHRLAVFDFGAEGGDETALESTTQPIRILAVVSQSDVVRWLASKLALMGDLGAQSLPSLRLSPKPVVTVDADAPALEAFAAILRAGLPAAGVRVGGKVVGALSLHDLKGLAADKLGALALPVAEYLAIRYSTVWASAHGHSTGETGLRRREVLLQQHTLLQIRPEATFGEVLTMMATKHARAIFVLDQDSAPLSVVTPTDILRVVSAE